MKEAIRWHVVVMILAASALLSPPAAAAPTATAPSDPGADPWELVPRDRVAEECGLDPDLMDEASEALAGTPFTVVRYGKLCWESPANDPPYHVFSVTKTMGALLFGIAASRSSLSDEDPVTRWLSEDELGAINPEARLAHILSMTSTKPDLSWGNKGQWSYDASGAREINRLVDVINRVIEAEPEGFPGISDICDLAQRELFDPLGMASSSWCSEAIGYGMQSTVRDLARMGLLIARQGVYHGERLIDAEYMYRMTHPAFPDTNTGYGYLTYSNAVDNWVYPTGRSDPEGGPVAVWPEYPHAPFHEAPDCNGGSPTCRSTYDVGANWATGAGGQRVVMHRGLDLVMVIRDDATNLGQINVWNAVRPALVALDPTFAGDEEAFLEAYRSGEYAPDLRMEPGAGGEEARPAGDAEPKQLLFLTHAGLYRHTSLGPAERAVTELGEAGGFEVTTVEGYLQEPDEIDLAFLTREYLEDFDGLMLMTNGNLPLSEGQKEAITDFVSGGKGFIGVHNASLTFYDYPEFGEMLGGYFRRPISQDRLFVLKVEDEEHPATRMLGPSWPIVDELYLFGTEAWDPGRPDENVDVLFGNQIPVGFSRDRVQVLLSIDTERSDLDGLPDMEPGGDYPQAWYRTYGDGRSFYSALGHRDDIWSNDPVFRAHVLGGIRWALGLED